MMTEFQAADVISEHPPLQPRLYRLERWLVRAGLFLGCIALAGEGLLLFIGLPGDFSVMPLLLLCTLALVAVLLIGSGLRPPVTVLHDGLLLHPMVGREQFVPWAAITEVRAHFLSPSDQAPAYPLQGYTNGSDRAGIWVFTRGVLPVRYRLVAWLTGLGNVAVFGLTAGTHQDYPALRALIEERTGF
ncbi:hypothetical protein ACFLYO_06485 [Chloroflexota bacterium]